MSNRFSRQEEYRIKRKLVFENIRRVFFASVACLVLVPVLMLIYKSAEYPFADTIRGALVFFEIFSAITAGISYTAIRTKDVKLSSLVYRSFWLLFELFSFVVIYSDRLNGSGFTFYAVMSIALLIVPAMNVSEQLYYLVLLAVYSVFMGIKFGISVNEIYNQSLTVALLFTISRLLYSGLEEKFVLREHVKSAIDNESIDQLTGLLNRDGMEKRAYASISSCISGKRRISILMIDIDDMCKYNDSYGSEHGDECIKAVSILIKQIVLRNTDTVCRLDGGRFLVYMEGGNDMQPVSLAEKVRNHISDKRIPQGRRAANKFVTVSIGVASCIPRSENDFSDIYDEAEDALYSAKEQGKNLTVYEEQIFGQYKRTAY